MRPPLLYPALRRCPPGLCAETSSDACACDPHVLVDADELTEAELEHYLAHGTPEQVADLRAWLTSDDPAELAAGRPDADKRAA